MWILIPTGGANRLLTRDGVLPESWRNKLTAFLGMNYEEFHARFYKKTIDRTLFGDELLIFKQPDSVGNLIKLYKQQLETIWEYVSEPFPLINTKGVVLFHFIMVSQVLTAKNIANNIISKFKENG